MSETWVQSGSGLHRAILDQRIRQVRLLVGLGMDVNKRDSAGKTPMMIACSMGSEELGLRVIRLLLKKGADVNRLDFVGRSVLSHSCINGKEDIVACLLDHDNLERNVPDLNGDTPLNLSAVTGQRGCLELLVRSLVKDGVPVDHRNKQGCTALLLATKAGNYGCARVLLLQGRSSVNSRDNECFMNSTEWAKQSQNRLAQELKRTAHSHRLSGMGLDGASLFGNHPRLVKSFLPPLGVAKWHEEGRLLSHQREQQEEMNLLVQSLEEKEHELREQRESTAGSGVNNKSPPVGKPSSIAQSFVFRPGKPGQDHYLTALFRMYQEQLCRGMPRPTTVPTGTGEAGGPLADQPSRGLRRQSVPPSMAARRSLARRNTGLSMMGAFTKPKVTLTVS
ncbi:uncharacterized protein [Asterias amurensis]|uniref:uncharacterized protein n=1 Tax=Asterias amurensis TaxID=7602 RepID=UPI003AB356F3